MNFLNAPRTYTLSLGVGRLQSYLAEDQRTNEVSEPVIRADHGESPVGLPDQRLAALGDRRFGLLGAQQADLGWLQGRRLLHGGRLLWLAGLRRSAELGRQLQRRSGAETAGPGGRSRRGSSGLSVRGSAAFHRRGLRLGTGWLRQPGRANVVTFCES